MWDWFAPSGRQDVWETATEITFPKRLVQQTQSEEEMAHDFLTTLARNSSGDSLVSWDCQTNFPFAFSDNHSTLHGPFLFALWILSTFRINVASRDTQRQGVFPLNESSLKNKAASDGD